MRFTSLFLGWLVLVVFCAPLGCTRSTPQLAPPAPVKPSVDPTFFDADTIDITTDWKSAPSPDAAPGAAMVSLTSSDGSGLRLVSLQARAVLYGPLAFTEVYLSFENSESRTREGTFSIALPESAAVSRFAMKLPAGWQEAEVVEKQAARATYESFLHRNVDPALFDKGPGNVFHGRVFPILAGERKEIVISWTEELPNADDPYRFALRGLPSVDVLDVQLLVPSQKKAFVLQRERWLPDRDFTYLPVKGSPDAVRAGGFAIARVSTADTRGAAMPFESVAVLIDSSASQATSYDKGLARLAPLLERLKAKTVHLACFDQEVVPVTSLPEAAKRTPGGGSDLASALRWIKTTGASRAIVVTDGMATAGPTNASRIAAEVVALKAAGVERIDAIVLGGHKNETLLRAVASAGLASHGVVVKEDETASADAVANRLLVAAPAAGRIDVPGASMSWPTSTGAGGLVYLEIDSDKPLRVGVGGRPPQDVVAEEAPLPLVARAVAKGRIEKLLVELNAPNAAPAEQKRLQSEIVSLSVRHRVLSEFTSMLVLETERDYARFNIRRDALQDVLTVGPRGVAIAHRDGPVFWASPSTTSPLVDPPSPTPPDTDRDGISDLEDACPMEPGAAMPDATSNGCPRLIQFTSSEIMILEQVQFEGGSTRIAPASNALLDAVAMVLSDHPELSLVSVQGHTDDRGPAAVNMALSKARAVAVRDALIKRGVDPDRLEAEGFGETQPIDSNMTEEGRLRNRRVHFIVIEKKSFDGRSRVRTLAPDGRSRRGKAAPSGDPFDGELKEIMALLAAKKETEALDRAEAWRKRAPGELLSAIAEGRALQALGRHKEAARAYGSLLDLATKPEHKRAAAGFLESVAKHHPPALDLAIEAYRDVLEERPDHPSSHRLLAFSLARAGRTAEGLEVILSALGHRFHFRYAGALTLLRHDAGVLARNLSRAMGAAERKELDKRLARADAAMPKKGGTLAVATWETDASDVDLAFADEKGALSFPWFDANDGYGPEFVLLDERATRFEVHLVRKGPSGFVMGKLSTVKYDEQGRLTFDDQAFVLMTEKASVTLTPSE